MTITRPIQDFTRAGCAKGTGFTFAVVNKKRGIEDVVPAILGLKKNRRTELAPSFPVIQISLQRVKVPTLHFNHYEPLIVAGSGKNLCAFEKVERWSHLEVVRVNSSKTFNRYSARWFSGRRSTLPRKTTKHNCLLQHTNSPRPGIRPSRPLTVLSLASFNELDRK